jgi:hypothetical protein
MMDKLPKEFHKLHRKWMPDDIWEASQRGEDVYIDDDGKYHLSKGGDKPSGKATCPDCGSEDYRTLGSAGECYECGGLFHNGKQVQLLGMWEGWLAI